MKDFTEGKIAKQLITFSLPIILGDFLQSLYLVIDAVWVGRLLGYEALAAISAVFPVLFFLISLLIGMSVATNILVGQSYGAKNKAVLVKVLQSSFFTIVFLSLGLSIVGVISGKSILKLINTPQSIMPDAHTYLIIIIMGFLFRALYNWFGGTLRGLGDSKTPLIILIISIILNVILTPLLIIGIGPFPRLGIAGSALGTVVAFFFSTLAGYFILIRKNSLFGFIKEKMSFDFKLIKKIFRVGIPVTFSMVIRSISWMAIVALVNKFGPSLTAAYGIGVRIDMFAFMPALSISIAVSSMTAQNIGAKKFERVSTTLKWAIMLSLGFSFLIYSLVNLFPVAIASIFTRDSDVLSNTVGYLRVISLAYVMFSFIFSFQGVIRGAGHTGYLMFFSIISMLMVRIPAAYFLAEHTSLERFGIWLAILISAFVAMLLNFFYYRSGLWRRKASLVYLDKYA